MNNYLNLINNNWEDKIVKIEKDTKKCVSFYIY